MADKHPRLFDLVYALLLPALILSACTGPERVPSPFDALPDHTARPLDLPQEPVSGPSFRILPDSELVFSPALADFSPEQAIPEDSPLRTWKELLADADNAQSVTAVQIIEKISRDYSVSPRLLLALLEYRAGVVGAASSSAALDGVFFTDEPAYASFSRQISWAANELNRGYYTSRVGGLRRITLADGVQVDISPEINSATAALQYMLGLMLGYHEWQVAVGPLGVYASTISLFGDPFGKPIEPLIPPGLAQPEMRLPFDQDEGWFFTAGPHAAWGSGAAWGALDFAPDEGAFGCYDSQAWVLAAADGWVVRSADGAVVQNLDGQPDENSGWTILYLHIAGDGRVPEGVYLRAGDPVGRPSCEGGPSTGTHLHIARRYNGEWIPADQDLPFMLDGWVSSGDGVEYNGFLAKDDRVIKALGYPADENKVSR